MIDTVEYWGFRARPKDKARVETERVKLEAILGKPVNRTQALRNMIYRASVTTDKLTKAA